MNSAEKRKRYIHSDLNRIMDRKEVVIFSLAVVAVLILAGCQEYLNKQAVGAGGNACPGYDYCLSNYYEDNRCQSCYEYMQGQNEDYLAYKLPEQALEARRPAFTDEEAADRFRARSEAQSDLVGSSNGMPEIVSAPQDNTFVESSGVVEIKESQEDFCKRVKKAREELDNFGITKEQAEAYKELLSELVYNGVKPTGYLFFDTTISFLPRLLLGRENAAPGREDFWRLYLGLPQQHNTFGVSDYQPSNSVENKYYYKIHQFLNPYWKTSLGENVDAREALLGLVLFIDERNIRGLPAIYPEDGYEVMYSYKLSKGKDDKGHYISYYDIMDLGVGIKGSPDELGRVGKPFEVYDRIYYNPETFEVIDEKDLPANCP